MTNSSKNLYLLSHDKTILVEEDKVSINSKTIDDLGECTPDQFAREKTREYYKRFLSNHFENLVVLTGAGSSIGIGKDRKGKTRGQLWDSVKSKVGEDKLKTFAETIKYVYPNEGEIGDVEALLSRAYGAQLFLGEDKTKDITNLIQAQIVEDCSLQLPPNSPHQLFLAKLTARKLKYSRVKIVTLNYDTLFEQAAVQSGHTIIDGFSFSFPRTFGGRYFDYDLVIRENSRIENEENYVGKLFHLYKPHGSLDWQRSENGVVKTEDNLSPLIIYPRDSKYENSYEQPFFEMMSRFQQSLRIKNSLLISIGFSFYDKHIRAMILEAAVINPSFRLLVIDPGITNNPYMEELRSLANSRNNIVLVNEGFIDFVSEYPYPQSYIAPDLKPTIENKLDELEAL